MLDVVHTAILVWQGLPFRLGRERNQQETNKERNRGASDRDTERSHAQHCRAKKKIHAGSNKTADGGAERERRRAHARLKLFRQP